jgi:putative DNA primase/helicase
MSSETELGQRLAQSKLKRLTQGTGTIVATRKYENPIEFRETHKLWLDTNRRPSIRDTEDEATFARLHPIPFAVQIPAGEIDRELPLKLLKEAEGILAWAVQGAVAWYQSGLGRPDEIDKATSEWRAENDRLAPFLDARCTIHLNAQVVCARLYREYRTWAESEGETPMTSTEVGRKLTARGIIRKHYRYGDSYLGVELKAGDQNPGECEE